MQSISWGIIGCGDVTELKSGPAFNKVKDSRLAAVMRRDPEKARDYATRHKVPRWYSSAQDLIDDAEVNAVYIATPPSSHEEYTLAAIKAGKPVYVEKPMSVDAASANRMAIAAREKNVKLSVAHYRRAQPLFSQVKKFLAEGAIGKVRFVRCELYKPPLTREELQIPKTLWRLDPAIAGGGLFHDLSPHQLDIMYHFFGETERVCGIAVNQARAYNADDLVVGTILFKNGVVFNGLWCFAIATEDEKDHCEIFGEKGSICFSFFEHKLVTLTVDGITRQFPFEPLQHVQQPMIEKVVDYFLGRGPNPNSGEEGAAVMQIIDTIAGHKL